MTLDLGELVPFAQQTFLHGWAVFLRVGAMVSLLPAFGEQSIPMRVRLAIAIAFVLIAAPSLPVMPGLAPVQSLSFLVLSISEAAIGLFFGVLLRFFVFSLQVAGAIAAQASSLSQIFGGNSGADPQPVIGHILTAAGLALLALLGLHVQFAVYILQSYEMIPLGAALNRFDFVQLGLFQVSKTFALAFSLAAPFLIASLLYNVTLGVINRAMPQLMVTFVGAPAITAGGLLILALSASFILTVWAEQFMAFVALPTVS